MDRPRVLVIDDDPLFRALIAGHLKNIYHVTTAETGPEGFQRAIDAPPHVVLIDVQMPGWNGIETLKRFRTHPQLARTKAAMLTGDAARETVVNAIRAGAEEYIVKTHFDRHELLRKLASLVERSSQASGEPSSRGMVCEDSSRPASGNKVENDWNPQLQGIIDHWE